MAAIRLSTSIRRTAVAAAALATVLGTVLVPGSGTAAAAGAVTVATYNICGQSPKCRTQLSPADWSDTLIQAVKANSPTVVNLQEVCAGQADLLRDKLEGYTVHFLKAVSLTPDQKGCQKWGGDTTAFGAAVLVNTFWTGSFHDLVLEPADPAAEKRPLICAGLAMPSGDDSYQVCNVHLESGLVGLRNAGLPTVVDRMRHWGEGARTILAGDFNADPTDPNLGILYAAQDGNGPMTEADDQDTAYFSPTCRGLRTCRSGAPTTADGRKFDYIFADPGLNHGDGRTIQVTGPDGRPLSDHLMYLATVSVRTGNAAPAAPTVYNTAATIGSGNDWANAVDRTAGDFTGDGRTDLVLRFASGTVMLYPGNGNGTFGAGRQLATGVTDALSITAGYFNDDANADLLVRSDEGAASIMEGDGAGHLGAPFALDVPGGLANAQDIVYGHILSPTSLDLLVRWGDQHFSARPVRRDPATGQYTVGGAVAVRPGGLDRLPDAADLVAGDFNGDRRTDLLIRSHTGRTVLYPGADTGLFASATDVADASGRSWAAVEHLTAGNFNADAKNGPGGTNDLRDDLVVTWMSDHSGAAPDGVGQTEFLPSTGATPTLFGKEVRLKGALPGYFSDASDALLADFRTTGTADLAIQKPDDLLFKPGRGTGTFGGGDTDKAWPAPVGLTAADFDGDLGVDLLSRDATGARLRRGTKQSPLGTYGDPVEVSLGSGIGWSQVADATAGRFSSTTHADLVVRLKDGRLFRFAGTPTGFDPAGVQITAGGLADWSDAVSITGGDFDGDGRDDLLVRWRAGSAFVYPGDGVGGLAGSKPVFAVGALSDLADLQQAVVYAGRPPVNAYRWSDGSMLLDGNRSANLVAPDAAVVTGTAPQLTVRASDDQGRVASFSYRLDEGPAVSVDAFHNTVTVPVGQLAPGAHTLAVTATDAAGLTSAETVWPFTRK
ncbi:FG-GAP-like repeat-containing protein [Kitasatospora sp. NPDC050463]|uniref:FG-GAP-like repeat-containing protein n=1 Tax=Kitasatospora sp. NPDC050463 TaxID=3155786 RepID=UPI003401833C